MDGPPPPPTRSSRVAASRAPSSRRGASAKLVIYFANVTAWSARAADWLREAGASAAYSVVGIAEHHLDAPRCAAASVAMRSSGWRWSGPPARSTKGKGTTGGVAWLTPLSRYVLSLPPASGHPAWHAVGLRLKGATFALVVLYLRPGEPHQAYNCGALAALATSLKQWGLEFIVCADWNMPPEALVASGWPQMVGGAVRHTRGPTCATGSTLDYLVVSGGAAAVVSGLTLDPGGPWRPHAGFSFEVHRSPRAVVGLQVRMPRPLAALPKKEEVVYISPTYFDEQVRAAAALLDDQLPETPEQADAFATILDKLFSSWSGAGESALNLGQIEATTKHIDHSLSQTRGVKLRIASRPIVATTMLGIPSARSCAGRWWSAVLARLGLISGALRTRAPSVVLLYWLQFRSCFVKLCVHAPVEERLIPFWTSALAMGAPTTAQQLAPLMVQARVSLKLAEAQVQAEARRSIAEWAAKAVAGGAKLGFAWIRREGGPTDEQFTRSEGSSDFGGDPGEQVLRESLTWGAAWAQPLDPSGAKVGRVSAEVLADLRHAVLGVAVAPEPITGTMVSSSLSRMRSLRARGSDMWQARELKLLPRIAFDNLAAIFNLCESSQVWPKSLGIVFASLVPKPKGGHRAVTVTSSFYALWSRVRFGIAAASERSWIGFWDDACRGSSALQAAGLRRIDDEAARAKGFEVAAALWDLAAFFDTVQLGPLVDAARVLQFPLPLLALALSMHSNPRLLKIGAFVGEPLPIERSIMAGCTLSMTFARMVVFHVVQRAATTNPTYADIRQFVDDLTLTIRAPSCYVSRLFLDMATELSEGLGGLALTTSPKTKVVASSPLRAKWLAKALRRRGIPAQASAHGTDLGVDFGAGSRRVVVASSARFSKARHRAARLRVLGRMGRRAGRLWKPGVLQVGSYGAEVAGLSPSARRRWRAMAATTLGAKPTWCTTTALYFSTTPANDPGIQFPLSVLRFWLRAWSAHPHRRQEWAESWAWWRDRLKGSAKTRWSIVVGPTSASIATLLDFGWVPLRPNIWTDPAGCTWMFKGGSLDPVLKAVQSSIEQALWSRAAEVGVAGAGLESGPWGLPARNFLRYLSDHRPEHHQLALAILSAGLWTRERLHRAGLAPEALCPRCSGGPETLHHLFWECPSNDLISDPIIARTAVLFQQSTADEKLLDAFWLRGLAPESWCDPTPIEADPICRELGAWHDHFGRNEIHIFTDGSGGLHSADPCMRRCGWSWVATASEDCHLQAASIRAAWGPLPASLCDHTNNRAELFAVVVALRSILSGWTTGQGPGSERRPSLMFFSDSAYVVEGWRKRAAMAAGAHHDLWAEAELQVSSWTEPVVLIKVPAHVHPDSILGGGPDMLHLWFGNQLADGLAAKGARAHQLSPAVDSRLQLRARLNRLVLKRLLTIALEVLPARAASAVEAPSLATCRPVKVKLVPAAVQHSFVLLGRTWRCSLCFSTAPASTTLAKRVSMECYRPRPVVTPPRPGGLQPVGAVVETIRLGKWLLHGSHSLRLFRGLMWCQRCGHYAVCKPRALLLPCSGTLAPGGAAAIRAIQRGRTPTGLAAWPLPPEGAGVVVPSSNEGASCGSS
jgi:ribonuclease HI